MELEGVVENGVIVPDEPRSLPEGARVRFAIVDEADELDELSDPVPYPDPSLPPDHPDAPYNREVELALLRESIAEMNAGGGRPWREVMEELSRKHGLDPLPE